MCTMCICLLIHPCCGSLNILLKQCDYYNKLEDTDGNCKE